MKDFTVSCSKCNKKTIFKHPTRATLSCQSCGEIFCKISFSEEIEDNAIIFRCQKCEETFVVKSETNFSLQCPSVKCGGFLLDSIDMITLSVILDQVENEKSEMAINNFCKKPLVLLKRNKFSSKEFDGDIRVAIPYYSGGYRIQRAAESWIYPEVLFVLTDNCIIPPGYGICSQLFTEKSTKSERLNNKTQPYLIDILSQMVKLFPNEKYYGYFNSDIILPPGSSIRSLLPDVGKKIVFHHRMEYEGSSQDSIYKLDKKYQVFCGKDGFIGEAQVIRDVIAKVKDMVLGGAAWDDGLAIWCFKEYGRSNVDLRYGEIYHVLHPQVWNANDKESTFNQKQLSATGVGDKERHSFNWFKEAEGSVSDPPIERQKLLGLIQPGRIGDIIIVLPIAKWFHDLGYKVIWPVVSEYTSLFDYVNYVEVVDLGPGLSNSYRRSQEALKKRGTFEVIDLGIGFGKNESEWEKSGLSFDEWKYKEAGVPFEERFNLIINRNFHKELDLQKKLDLLSKKDFSITHSVGSKGRINFSIENVIEIEPILGFTVFDWIGIIEKAHHVYCADSCIAHLVNQLGLAKGRRTFFPLKDYHGRSLAMAVPKINWEEGVGLRSKARKMLAVPDKSSGALLVSLPGLHTGNWPLYPLGLGYLHSSLKRDRDVHSIHFQKQSHIGDILPKVIKDLKPSFVGFTCTTFNRGNVRRGIEMVRSCSPESKVILGGVHPTFLPSQMLENYGADYVVMGEGENTLRDLCGTVDENGDLSNIRGIAYKDDLGRIQINDSVIPMDDLDFFPHPDFSYAEQMIKDSKMGSIITSRGCPAKCGYCSTSHYWGQKVRTHSVDWILDEIERQIDIYGINKLLFHDDSFNLSSSRVQEICDGMIKRKFNLSWAAQGRVHPVSQEMIDSMVEAGCRHICWGVESGSKTMLQSMNKKINLDQIKRAYDLCSKYKDILTTGAFTMVGYPGENSQTIKETCDFLNTVPMTDSPSTSILYILPGTDVYKQLENKIDDDYWVNTEDVFYNTIENSIDTLHGWANKVNNSGKKISSDPSKHFWNNILFGNIVKPKPPSSIFEKDLNWPIHFFTIVLNGMPFIKYHIKMLETLPFDWCWHIVEGVADLKYDTAWSLKTGGRITEKLHKNGLSNDGTSEYVDSLKERFPDKIFVYRKEPGKFWDGKVEMVNAPIPNLPDRCLLWQIDVDEFWDFIGISKMAKMFEKQKDKMSAFVYCHYFVGPTKVVTSMNTWGTLPEDWLRVFRFYRGMYWSAHEPPTLVDKNGINCGRKNPISRDDTLKEGILFQHFAYVIPQQVLFKEIYYGYKDAINYWGNLQKSRGSMIDVSMYLPWANSAIIEKWEEKKHGKLLYPGELL